MSLRGSGFGGKQRVRDGHAGEGGTGEVGLKQRYRVTNCSKYDRALVSRGNLTI
jgi:hypothetical protein